MSDNEPINEIVQERLQGASARLTILAACAFARTVWHLLQDPRSRKALETVERFADGLATAWEVEEAGEAARGAAMAVWDSASETPELPLAAGAATKAVRTAQTPAQAVILAAQTAARVEWAARWAAPEPYWEATKPAKPAKAAAEAANQSVLHCLLPSRASFSFPAHVKGLAATIYEKGDWSLMPILADALEDIGQAEMAAHCQQPIHAKGCHVLDSILGLG